MKTKERFFVMRNSIMTEFFFFNEKDEIFTKRLDCSVLVTVSHEKFVWSKIKSIRDLSVIFVSDVTKKRITRKSVMIL